MPYGKHIEYEYLALSEEEDFLLKRFGVYGWKRQYLRPDETFTSDVMLSYPLDTTDFGWCLSVQEYERVVEALKLSDIGQEEVHTFFQAICLPEIDSFPQAPKPCFVEVFAGHPAHTFVGKLALWCLLSPFA